MKHLILIISLLFSIFSCSQVEKKNKNQNKDSLELDVISSVIDELIEVSPIKPPPPFPYVDSIQYEKNKLEYEMKMKDYEIKKDTTTFRVQLRKIEPDETARFSISIQDSAYMGLAGKLKKKPINPELEISKINFSNEKINIIDHRPKGWDTKFDFLGIGSFSNVVFNKDKTLALFYFDFSCGGLCGSGHFILVEKYGNSWKIIRNDMIWVS